MNTSYVCRYCGKPTSEVDYDYLVDYDHLTCTLENEMAIRKGYEALSEDTDASFTVPFKLIIETPNDQILGAKVRELYYESKNNS